MDEQRVSTDSGRFHCLIGGPAGAPAIVYLHGFPDYPPTSMRFLNVLARAGHRVIAPWLRGYAPSATAGPFTVEQLTEDVLALARAIAPGRQIHIVGHDWGAVIAYAVMASAPDAVASSVTLAVPHPLAVARSLARSRAQLARSWYMLFFQLPHLPEWLVGARDMAFIDRLWRVWSPGFVLPEPERRALHRCLRQSMPAPIEYYRAMLRPPGQARARVRWLAAQRITTPTLHVHGELDGCIGLPAARGHERFFAGPFAAEVVPGVGHFMQQEAPAAIAERVLAWYARHPAPALDGPSRAPRAMRR